jgi:C4-dicarboxylate-specific signal transduction histidine kinase
MPTNFKRLRARLVLLVMLALVPAAALILHNASVEHDALLRAQREDNARLARLAAMQQARLIEGAHQLLIALARSPAVRSGSFDGCSEYLAELVAQYRWYSIFGVAAPNGDVVCHSRKPEGRVNIADRSYFRRALQTQAFTVGEYQIGRTSGQASFSLANPIRAADGTVAAVMFASVRMDEFDR